ncbi:MAG TPA: farnesyl diphosphate synthase [Thermoleophilaceae bacterium]
MSAPARQAEYPVALQREVDAYLEDLRFSEERTTAGLEEAMRYSLLAGGKRIRPVLALATAEALGHEQQDVMALAAAIELIHTYSLIHDDLPAMDDDELRRGKPTCHVVYGEDVAILAGDGLFAEAIKLVLDEQDGEPERVLRALRHLVAAISVSGMVGGQYVDVKETAPHDEAGLRHLHALKTGRLIAAAIECPLLLFGAGEAATMGLRRYAAELGVLFQIVDDILDVTGDEAALGKPQGSDERHGKRTYVSVFGLERARELARDSHAGARAALADAGGQTATLEQITDYILTRDT